MSSDQSRNVAFLKLVQMQSLNVDLQLRKLARCLFQRVIWTDFAVAIGANKKDVPAIGIGEDMGQQIKRRCVGPLQVVHDHRKQLIAGRERSKEICKQAVESVARLDWRQGWNWRLRASDEL